MCCCVLLEFCNCAEYKVQLISTLNLHAQNEMTAVMDENFVLYLYFSVPRTLKQHLKIILQQSGRTTRFVDGKTVTCYLTMVKYICAKLRSETILALNPAHTVIMCKGPNCNMLSYILSTVAPWPWTFTATCSYSFYVFFDPLRQFSYSEYLLE